MPKYTPKYKEKLKKLIKNKKIYLGDIDTRKITDMSKLFFESNRKCHQVTGGMFRCR